MERWNELIAGHVLDNLTDSEQEELSEILAKNPHLTSEIERLRSTATLQSVQPPDGITNPLPAGAEGWTDMLPQVLDASSETSLFAEVPAEAAFPPAAQQASEFAPLPAASLSPVSRFPAATNLPEVPNTPEVVKLPGQKPIGRVPFQKAPLEKRLSDRLWRWIVLLLIVGLGIDNWRLRQMLAIAQEKLTQLEATAELVPKSVD